MSKIKYDNLYVACPVFDLEDEEEPFEQYESFGRVNHHVLVTPKRVLIYSKTNESGETKYYRYPTGEEVKESSYRSSFLTNSSPSMSVYCGYINGHFPLPIPGLRDECLARHAKKRSEVGYFIPFDEYIEKKLGFSIPIESASMAHKIVRLLNIGHGKTFHLSHDEIEAALQLEKLGYSCTQKTIKN